MIEHIQILIFLFAIELQGKTSGEVVPVYLGCYQDSRDDVRLSGHKIIVKNLTATQCNFFCFNHAHIHAATRNGKECLCGDLQRAVPDAGEESLCNIPCSGDITTMCGGKGAYSLYSTGIKEEDLEDVEDLEIGCIDEKGDSRLIGEHKVDLLRTNTPRRCIAYCRALGYPHAGLQYSSECYCGLAKRTGPLVVGCYKPCSGNPRQKCGGQWKSMVYSTGSTKPNLGILWKGCYEYNMNITETSTIIEQMSPNICVSFCYLKAYQFAFIFNGTKCFCSKKIPPSRYRTSSEQCYINCKEDSSYKCGGDKYMSIYNTGIAGHPSLGKLLGCYEDDNGNLLKGVKLNLGSENSVEYCISRCIALGYAFAGLRNIYECMCGHTSPKRVPVSVVPDKFCSSPCSRYELENCGAPLFTAVHRTGLAPSVEEECLLTVSRVNGKKACGGQVLFYDEFNSLDLQKWKHSVKISGEDGEFVTYTSKKKNVFTEDGKLIIRPTLVTDNFIKHGTLELKGCTGNYNSTECKNSAKSFNILPPIESGQICTKDSFNFLFGNVSIQAKMPRGDWVVPQIWLKPAKNIYGPEYLSGKLLMATSRGNEKLLDQYGQDIGAKRVESGFQIASDKDGKVLTKTTSVTSVVPSYSTFLNYHLTWNPDKILFSIHGDVSSLQSIYTYTGDSLLNEVGLGDQQRWTSGTILAPFDQEFYLCIGVSVGGIRSFPDGSFSGANAKPWQNEEIKGRLKFWLNRHLWQSTWSNETRLEIDYIKVTAS